MKKVEITIRECTGIEEFYECIDNDWNLLVKTNPLKAIVEQTRIKTNSRRRLPKICWLKVSSEAKRIRIFLLFGK